MKTNNRIVYSLDIEDIQHVALESLGRPLTEPELQLVENNLGDYVPWYDIIEDVIQTYVKTNLDSQPTDN